MNEFNSYLSEWLPDKSSAVVDILIVIAIILVGWFISRFISRVVGKLISKSSVEKKAENTTSFKLSVFVRKLIFYVLMLFVLLIVLEKMGVQEVLQPLEDLFNSFVSVLPNLLYAFVIAFIGYFVAKLVAELVGLGAKTLESFAIKMKLAEPSRFVNLVKRLVFIIIFVPLLIQAIDLLNLNAISDPAKSMLTTFIDAIPNIVAAVVIIGFFFFVGRYLTNILKDILKSFGVDNFAKKIGFGEILGTQSASNLIGNILFFFVMFAGVITGVEKLELFSLTDILNELLALSGSIMFGLLIMAFGNYLSKLAYKNLMKSDDNKFIANIAKWTILGMFLAISLRAMGIANEIVYLAFGLTLGAVAVAFALMFGLGGREAAGKHVAYILDKFRKEKK